MVAVRYEPEVYRRFADNLKVALKNNKNIKTVDMRELKRMALQTGEAVIKAQGVVRWVQAPEAEPRARPPLAAAGPAATCALRSRPSLVPARGLPLSSGSRQRRAAGALRRVRIDRRKDSPRRTRRKEPGHEG